MAQAGARWRSVGGWFSGAGRSAIVLRNTWMPVLGLPPNDSYAHGARGVITRNRRTRQGRDSLKNRLGRKSWCPSRSEYIVREVIWTPNLEPDVDGLRPGREGDERKASWCRSELYLGWKPEMPFCEQSQTAVRPRRIQGGSAARGKGSGLYPTSSGRSGRRTPAAREADALCAGTSSQAGAAIEAIPPQLVRDLGGDCRGGDDASMTDLNATHGAGQLCGQHSDSTAGHRGPAVLRGEAVRQAEPLRLRAAMNCSAGQR